MIKLLLYIILVANFSLQDNRSLIRDHVEIMVYPYEREGETKASAMPELRSDSELMVFKRRFEYLLINVSEVHKSEKAEVRNEIWKLYPDTIELKHLYLNEFVQDDHLVRYFEESYKHIRKPDLNPKVNFREDELMEVASKFFYCDKVLADTSVQAHICIGLNGVSEANWSTDYTLLEAFCYEAIFSDLGKEDSPIRSSFGTMKEQSVQKYKAEIGSLDEYLENVKLDVFDRMKSDHVLRENLLEYYELNKDNLAFQISE